MIKQTILLLALAIFLTGTASASDVGTVPPTDNEITEISIAAASSESTVDNGDGTYTYTQIVDEDSTPPHYVQPSAGGFEIYSWWNEDYGWNHTFDMCNDPNISINSVQLEIRAWDVDSEPSHGWEGEYDHITADGVDLNPVYLQGHNDEWSVTTFDVDPALLTDDCTLNVFMDIDIHTEDDWATELDKSKLIVNYTLDGTSSNNAPHEPTLEITPNECVNINDDLVASVTGPNPADPDGDSVTYQYRWFVDIGTGGFLDDEFALGIDHTGNTVPAADTSINETWMVRVIPIDEHGVRGPFTEVTFSQIVEECPTGGNNGEENGTEIPEFPTVVLPVAAVIGLAMIFQNRKKE